LNLKFFRCFILLFLSPLCLGYTSRQAQAEKQKVLQIMHSSPDVQSKIRNTQNLVALYNRVSPYMPRRQRQRLDSLVARHTDAILVDGVPSQGGRKSKYATGVLSTVAKETAVGFFNELGGAVYNWLQSLVQGDSTTKK
ncbi:hypothetical protein KR054_007269, partial [Drosophila jambulina]